VVYGNPFAAFVSFIMAVTCTSMIVPIAPCKLTKLTAVVPEYEVSQKLAKEPTGGTEEM
jgi:hypothetical protein